MTVLRLSLNAVEFLAVMHLKNVNSWFNFGVGRRVAPRLPDALFECYPDSDNPACPGFPQTQRDNQRFQPHPIISKLVSMADASVGEPVFPIAPPDKRSCFSDQLREASKIATNFKNEIIL